MKRENKVAIKVLKNTGHFRDPESDLKDIFDLKASGREAFLFGCYGSFRCHAYYLYSDEMLIVPSPEEEILKLPPVPLGLIKLNDIPDTYSFLPAMGLLKKEERLLDKILGEDKYIVFMNSRWWVDYQRQIAYPRTPYDYLWSEKVIEQHNRNYREEVANLRKEVVRRGIDPLNVLVVDGAIDKETEGFLTPYLAGVKLREKNYLVSEHSFGISSGADLFAYRAKKFGGGAFMAGLIMGIEEIEEGASEPSACVIEIEAQKRICHSRHGIAQAIDYVIGAGGYFGKGFVAAPLADEYQIKEAEKRGVGIVSFDENGEIIFRDCKGEVSEKQLELTEEVKNVAYLARECFSFLSQRL